MTKKENLVEESQTIRPDLDAIQARVDKATPGPWLKEIITGNVVGVNYEFVIGEDAVNFKEENINFIANSREDIPTLLAYCRELERERDELKMRIAELEDTESGISFSAPGDLEDRMFDDDPDIK